MLTVAVVCVGVSVLLVGAGGAPAAARAPAAGSAAAGGDSAWEWPVAGAVVTRPYAAPATRYGAGHRGIDLGGGVAVVVAPADGVVVFAGRVVDRVVVTLDVGGGTVVSVEPLATAVAHGAVVARGQPLGTIDLGGHTAPGEVHVGVRVGGEYVDPMRFFGGVVRAVLLPCC